jgi:hypothetical protein
VSANSWRGSGSLIGVRPCEYFRPSNAYEFRSELASGRTRPCVLACEDSLDQRVGEYATKLRSRVSPGGLLFEFIASHLAEELGLPVPEAAIITISEDLTSSVPEQYPDVGRALRESIGPNFGTRMLPAGMHTWPKDESVPTEFLPQALDIFAFDALIENPDRRRDRPNLLWDGKTITIIDHETAFSFLYAIAPGPGLGGSRRLAFLKEHPFFEPLHQQDSLNLDRFRNALEALDTSSINQICDSAPASFGTDALRASIAGHLVATRDGAEVFCGEILEVLR